MMAMMEIDSLSGYQFDQQQALNLLKSINTLKGIEVLNSESHLNLYFEQVTHDIRD